MQFRSLLFCSVWVLTIPHLASCLPDLTLYSKIIPSLAFKKLDAKTLLKKRYKGITKEGLELLISEFEEKVKHIAMDEWHQMLFFEIMYGRGSRFIINGGKVVSNQYFIPVHPFIFKEVFQRFFSINSQHNASYKSLWSIWKNVDKEFYDAYTSEGVKPLWNPFAIRSIRLFMKSMGRVGIYKKTLGYAYEVKRIKRL